MRTSLTRKIVIGFGFSLLILLASAVASFISIRNLLDSAEWVNHTHEVLADLDDIVSPLKDAEASQRGFLLTGDQDYLEPLRGAFQASMTALQKVKDLTVDNMIQQQNAEELRGLLTQRFNKLQAVIDTKKINNTINLNDLKEGKGSMEKLLIITRRMKSEELRLLSDRTSRLDIFKRFTPVMIIIASIVAMVISLVFFTKVRRDIIEKAILQSTLEEKEKETTNRISIIRNIADKISSGNYKIRVNDEESDGLGSLSSSLNKMASSLDESFRLLSEKEWLQTGAAKLSESMVGEKNMGALTHNIIAYIAGYTHCHVGAFYLVEDRLLILSGGYALEEDKIKRRLKIGEGLAGECALTGKPLLLEDIPADNIYISFSAGKVNPVNIVLYPVFFENTIKAVIELGSVYAITPQHQGFLTHVAESIGIAINTAQSRAKLQDLLEETQTQTEELQAQHNELEALNAGMESQTEKLQLSEEELKVQQEELLAANRELEERTRLLEEKNYLITDKNLEIQKKAEELATSTKYKSEFLANMSHELRTPLNSILLLSRLLSENNDKNLTVEQVEYAQVIRSSGNGLLELIDEILDLSKIEAGKMDLEYTDFTLAEIVDDMRMLFSPMAKEKNIYLDIRIEKGTPPRMESDKLKLEQVLKNLVSNALKFTNQGGIELSITPDAKIASSLNFIVKDTGIGIPREKQDLIFEAFQQADGSTRRKYGGTGLGLSISRELVRLLGGQLSLESKTGEGSIFIVNIPLAKPSTDSSAQETPSPENRDTTPFFKDQHLLVASTIPGNIDDDRNNIGENERVILIVEDDVNFAKSLLDFARKKGYRGVVAVRGDEGIKLAIQFKPAGILLDIQLPIKNGWEVMEELKNNPKTKHIPVHIMSSFEVKHESLLKGAVDFINKPVAFEQMTEIFNKIEYVLNREAKKVLIVEENSRHARALAYYLGTFDVKSEISATINDSIHALHKKEVDCVILDMGVPDTTAYEMLENVKNSEGLENVPIIIFTGKNLSRVEEVRIRRYADSIVVKTAHSYQRILDEVSLFLHLVDEHRTAKTFSPFEKLGALNEVLKDKIILVADDDVRNIFSLTKALEQHRMKVLPALDGKEALAVLAQNPEVDIILMDMMMPEMDGYDTIRNIKKLPAFSGIPVIAVTAKAMTGDREKCISAGASDYISKPVDVDQLMSLLRIWLYEK